MANRFWVGGAGTWDSSSTANWSATTGGAPGASAPVTADAVIFDASSGSGTCAVASTAAAGSVTANAANITVQLSGNASVGTVTGYSHQSGVLNFNNFALTCDTFTCNTTSARTTAFGSSGKLVITRTTAVTNAVDFYNATTLPTVTGTALVEFTGVTAAGVAIGIRSQAALPANPISVNIKAGAGTFTLTSGFGFGSINFTGFTGTFANSAANIYGNYTLASGMTVTGGTGTTVFLATSGIQQFTSNGVSFDRPITQNNPGATLQLQDNLTMGSTRTFTFTAGDLHINNRTLSTGLFNSSNSNIRTIDFKSGNITTTGSGTVWTTATLTNFSYLGTPTVNISNNSATATTVSTGAMTAAQALNFNYTIGTYTLTDTAAVYKSVNFTGFSGTIPNSVRTIYGGLTVSAGMTLTAGANVTTFAATSGTNNITTAAKTLDFPITFNGIGGTWAFQDALTQGSTRAFTITNGTVQLKASATSTTGAFATSGTNQKYLQSTTPGSQATLTQASGTIDATYLSIKDIVATGGATWNALWSNNNVDEGNNSGWVFGDPPIISAVEYTYALKSFTQPRRF